MVLFRNLGFSRNCMLRPCQCRLASPPARQHAVVMVTDARHVFQEHPNLRACGWTPASISEAILHKRLHTRLGENAPVLG